MMTREELAKSPIFEGISYESYLAMVDCFHARTKTYQNGEIILNPLFTFREAEKAGDGFGNTGKVEGSLEQIGTLKHREKLRLAGYRV